MVRCDMCMNEAWTKHTDPEGRELNVCNACDQLLFVREELLKLNQFWIDKYNKLKLMIEVIDRVKTNNLNELNKKIKSLEKQLSLKSTWQCGFNEKRIKALAEQVDLNAQTLEELK